MVKLLSSLHFLGVVCVPVMYVHVYTCICGGQILKSPILLNYSVPIFLRQDFSLNLVLNQTDSVRMIRYQGQIKIMNPPESSFVSQ